MILVSKFMISGIEKNKICSRWQPFQNGHQNACFIL